jgi:hypothetical protein
MADKESLVIDVTPEKKAHIEMLAHEHGYASPGEYLLALVDALDDEPTKEELLANLRQGLKETLRGEVLPIDTLWDDLDDEPETSSV